MPEYPECPHRIDTEQIESLMRGVIEKRIEPVAQNDVTKACGLILNECVDKLKRVLYLVEEMRGGLCGGDDDEE